MSTFPVRFGQLVVGLFLYGLSLAMLIRAGLGLDPWDCFHQGLAGRLPVSFGTVVVAVGAAVLLVWIPLRQRPGVGTVANVILLGPAVDVSLWLLPEISGWRPGDIAIRVLLMVTGVVINGAATGLYIGAGMGPGPRDGLMTGLAARTGRSLRLVRTAIELTVLATGWVLGGTVGVATLLYAVAIGPLAQAFLGRFRRGSAQRAPARAAEPLTRLHS